MSKWGKVATGGSTSETPTLHVGKQYGSPSRGTGTPTTRNSNNPDNQGSGAPTIRSTKGGDPSELSAEAGRVAAAFAAVHRRAVAEPPFTALYADVAADTRTQTGISLKPRRPWGPSGSGQTAPRRLPESFREPPGSLIPTLLSLVLR